MAEAMYEAGLAVRRDVLGAEYVDRALASADDFSRPFQEFITEHCWGDIWTRPGLPRQTRSLLNVAILTALSKPTELELHVRGALRNGCTKDEIFETLLQATVYCGVPTGVEAMRAAQRALADD